jgi:hypothetical protein
MTMTTTDNKIVMVRADRAGIFFGTLISHKGDTVTLTNSRRCWWWDGAASISELATLGTSKPTSCKFPAAISGIHTIMGVIEILPITPVALVTLNAVPVWTEHK